MRSPCVVALSVSLLFGGCSSDPHIRTMLDMTEPLVTQDAATVLMTLELSRSDNNTRTPVPEVLYYIVPPESDDALPQGHRQVVFSGHGVFSEEEPVVVDGRRVYLIRMRLKPGGYRVCSIAGTARSGIMRLAQFSIPLLRDFEVKAGTVSYQGRITATLRPNAGGEFRAGSTSPMDRASGFGSSTWDIEVQDQSAVDIPALQHAYPALRQVTINREVGHGFDRAAVQRWSDLWSAFEEQASLDGVSDALGRPAALERPRATRKPPPTCTAPPENAGLHSAREAQIETSAR